MAIDRPWEEYPYKVFVSYSHDDQLPDGSGKSWGAWLEEALEAYEVPSELVGRWSRFGTVPARIQPVFRDRSGFSAAADVRAAIRTALDDSATMIVVCGPKAAQSTYVNDEIAYFKSKGRTGQIFALICDGEPNSGDARECFPAALTHKVNTDGEILKTAEEPLAADARPGKDEPDLALLKIIAALLRVPLASLREKTNSILEARLKEQQALADRLRSELLRSTVYLLGTLTMAGVAGISFGVAFLQGQETGVQRDQGLITQSRYLADQAIQAIKGCPGAQDCDPRTAALIALEAVPGRSDRPETPEAAGALQRAVFAGVRDKGTLVGHSSTVTFAQSSPNGKVIVTASEDGIAKLWEATTGLMLAALKGHTAAVNHAEFSPDGKSIVTASSDNTAKIWDAATGEERATLKGHTHAVWSAQFSPDGKTIVTASMDNTAKLWDAATGQERATLNGHINSVVDAEFSFESKTIVTVSEDRTAKIWDAATGQERATLDGHTDWVVGAQFSPDGKSIVTASGDNTAKIWDTATGRERASLTGHRGAVWSAQYSPDGKTIVTASLDGTSKVWEAATGAERATLAGHRNMVWTAQFSPDGKSIVTASSDNTARLWDAATGAERATLQGHANEVNSAQFLPNGTRIVTASDDTTAKIWDASTGLERVALTEHGARVLGAQFSLDGKAIVAVSVDNTIKLWDAESGAVRATLKGQGFGLFFAANFSPDGKSIVITSATNTAKIWDVQTGQQRITFKGHTNSIMSAQFSPDGKNVVIATNDRTAKILDARTGTERATLRGHAGQVISAQFSPDGNRIVTAAADNTAKIWDGATGVERATLKGHTGTVISAQFSPDGNRIVTASADNTAKIWNASAGQERATLTGHLNTVVNAQFSPDGKSIVTASSDTTAKIWDATTGLERATLKGHRGTVRSAQFSPNGKSIVTVSDDGSAKVWDVAMYRSVPHTAYAPLAELSVESRLTDDKRRAIYLDVNPKPTAPPPAVNACDHLAGHPQDPDRMGAGVAFDDLVADNAIVACAAAIRAEPETARFYVQLSRAQQKAGAWDKAFAAAQEAARRDSAMGYLRIAQIHREPKSGRYDMPAAIRAYREANKRGLDIAGLDLAQMYRDGVTKADGTVVLRPDLSQAVALWRDLIARGNAAAHAQLAEAAERKLNPKVLTLSLDQVLYHYAMAAELAYQKGEPANAFVMARRAMLARFFWRAGKEDALVDIWSRVSAGAAPKPFYRRWLGL